MRPGLQYSTALRGRRGLGSIQLETPDTGLGPTGTDIVATYGGVGSAPAAGPAPLPSLSSMTPTDLVAGVPAIVTFDGANFLSGDTVHSAGFTVQSVSVVSSSRIVARVTPAAYISLKGSFLAAVLTPQGQESNAVPFTVTGAAAAAPVQQPVQYPTQLPPSLPPTIGTPVVVQLPTVNQPSAPPSSSGGGSGTQEPGVVFDAPSFEGQVAPPVQGSGDQAPASSSSGVWAQLGAVPWWVWGAAAVGVGYLATRPGRRRR